MEAAGQQRKEAFTKYFPNISATGLWFNANKGMAQTTVNPSEAIPSSLASSLATSLPAEALAALANPISVSMLKNGTIAGITAMQPVFTGGQIINGNRLARVGEDVARLQLQLSENEVEKTAEQYYWQLVSLQEKMKTIAAVEALLTDIHKDVDVAVRAGVALRSIQQSEENLRLHRDRYHAGTCRMSDLLEAQLLYQQSCDKHTDAYADLQHKLLAYRQSIGQ